MTTTTFERAKLAACALVILMGAHAIVVAQEGGLDRTLIGVWSVTIVPRNCATGLPIPTATNEGLWTFHADGTLSVWAQNNVIVTTRSPSHGLWRHDKGWSDYSYKFVHLRYSQTTAAFLGKQEGQGTLVLGESGDDFVTDGTATVFDVNGNPGTVGCSNSFGTRFKIDF